MSTLRTFPTLRKNCYTVKVGKGQKVLIRASFFYGNYDGKDSPPTFQLHFDGNFWATVNTSSLRGVYHEAIYVTKKNTTSVCVAQTFKDQIPFISGLEIRSLEMSMYSHVDSGRALFLSNRANAGANFSTRYPDDAYDRIWRAEGGFVLVDNVVNKAPFIDASKAEDQPPLSVLRTATTTTGTLWGIVLNTDLPSTSQPIYITAYFSEVTRLRSNETRSIQVEINQVPYSQPFVPPFGAVSELRITNRTANSNTSVAVFADRSSNLPPLLNAYEVYTVSGALTDGTDNDDVEGLAALQRNFGMLQKWSGDPCLPSSFSWEWLECNSDASPRVTTLNLGGYGLSGPLPDFSSMTDLETIDLHNNSLSGPIPSFLGSFPKLKLLNLADNRFSGTIPKSLSQNKNLKLILTGNCLSGMSCPPLPPSTPSHESPSTPPPSHETPSALPPSTQPSHEKPLTPPPSTPSHETSLTPPPSTPSHATRSAPPSSHETQWALPPSTPSHESPLTPPPSHETPWALPPSTPSHESPLTPPPSHETPWALPPSTPAHESPSTPPPSTRSREMPFAGMPPYGAAEGPVAGSGVQPGGSESRKMTLKSTAILSLSLLLLFLHLSNY
ncbi:probable LRR receptor-like serine/threonine-protein kinase At5g59680 [Neltuma alba]|uniref:probable LRR receptor-like serine/threonine-protein kinase At5g59680 n=1 Tax=Neltuma alba TaxID=207710 RepID=UPI0010A3C043|nr:probable LRR receptor-like serine/threonine-protein kinase At5g59680 [Prosopis alba]